MNKKLEEKVKNFETNKEYFKGLYNILDKNLISLFFMCLSYKNKGISKEDFSFAVKKWCDKNDIETYELKNRNIIFEMSRGTVTLKHNMSSVGFNVELK